MGDDSIVIQQWMGLNPTHRQQTINCVLCISTKVYEWQPERPLSPQSINVTIPCLDNDSGVGDVRIRDLQATFQTLFVSAACAQVLGCSGAGKSILVPASHLLLVPLYRSLPPIECPPIHPHLDTHKTRTH